MMTTVIIDALSLYWTGLWVSGVVWAAFYPGRALGLLTGLDRWLRK